jgi:Mn-containing catalase
MFMQTLESMNKLDDPMFGELKPDDTVDVCFNLTTDPEAKHRGPWNKEPEFHIRDLVQQAQQGSGAIGGAQQARHSPSKR